jgi:hypothetical protein
MTGGKPVRYKLKWKAAFDGPLSPEMFETEEAAKTRARELISQHPQGLVLDVWNEAETWQIVTPAGMADWCKQ